MAVTGVHALLYTAKADGLRRVLGDALGWSHVDAGGGWLIFALPPAEVGVHPADQPHHELTLVCDDLDTTVTELRAKGIEFTGQAEQQRWGRAITMVLPGGLEMPLYEPSHLTAF